MELEVFLKSIEEILSNPNISDFLKFLKTGNAKEVLPSSDINTIIDRTSEMVENLTSDAPIDKLIGIVQAFEEGIDIYEAFAGNEEDSPFEVNEYKIILDTARDAWDSFSESYEKIANGYDYVHIVPAKEESEEDESNKDFEEELDDGFSF